MAPDLKKLAVGNKYIKGFKNLNIAYEIEG